jgi:hypothetical protein
MQGSLDQPPVVIRPTRLLLLPVATAPIAVAVLVIVIIIEGFEFEPHDYAPGCRGDADDGLPGGQECFALGTSQVFPLRAKLEHAWAFDLAVRLELV